MKVPRRFKELLIFEGRGDLEFAQLFPTKQDFINEVLLDGALHLKICVAFQKRQL